MSTDDTHLSDGGLNDSGTEYARRVTETLERYRAEEQQALNKLGGIELPAKPLTIWTSTRRRTVETAQFLFAKGYVVRQRSQLSALNPGICEKMSERRMREEMSEEIQKHDADPYHHRYPRAESYHDLAVSLEPVILELERQKDDLLVIAHESVLRVLYGYLMACEANDIPSLLFPRDEIIEIIPASYNNVAKRIKIAGLPNDIIPSSPEGIEIPVPASGTVSPLRSLGEGSPQHSRSTNDLGGRLRPPEIRFGQTKAP